jgi:F420-dependent oxidoreductase-like protein
VPPLAIGISATGGPGDLIALARGAESLGAHSCWTAETWGHDALTPLAFLAGATTSLILGSGIAQIGARTPAMLAMSALSLQALSGGRFILGIGVSGPQVMEGWHGVEFAAPVARTRETIEIVRQVTRGEHLSYEGRFHRLPLRGRSLRVGAEAAEVPIWVASLGPANLRLTGELADGWIGQTVIPEAAGNFFDHLREGASAAGRSLDEVACSAMVSVEFGDTEEVAARHARGYAFTIGAMGSADRNFYTESFERQGFGEAVRDVQRRWLDGDRAGAAATVPLELALQTNLLGSDEEIKARLRAYRAAGFSLLRANLVAPTTSARLDTLGRLLDLVAAVDAE